MGEQHDIDRTDRGARGAAPDPDGRVRQAVARAVATARLDLARDEDERRRIQSELDLMLSSKGRLGLMSARRKTMLVVRGVVQPWRGIQAVPVLLSRATARYASVFAAFRALRHQSIWLRHEPIDVASSHSDAAEVVRWTGPVAIAGRTKHVLDCPPDSSGTLRVHGAAGATLTVHVALPPATWLEDDTGVTFTLEARGEARGESGTRAGQERDESGTTTRQVSRHIHPCAHFGDRRWRTLRLAIPDGVAGPVLITFRTTRPGGAPSGVVSAYWGDPCLEWPRSLLKLARVARANVRQVGWRGAFSKFLDYNGHDEERARFRRWVELNTPSAAALTEMAAAAEGMAHQPVISVITPVYNTDPQWLVACIESVRRQAYPNWELCLADDASTSAETAAVLARYAGDPKIKIVRLERNQHISAASNAALACATGEFVAMLDHDDELPPEALVEVVKSLNDNPTADFVYSDEDKIDTAGERCEPYFKPDWSPEMFRSFMYTNHLMVLRRSVVDAAGGFRVGFEGSQDYDLALRVIERTDRIVHIPKILYHWRKIPGSAAAEVEAKPWALKAARRALEEHLRRTGVDAQVVPGMLTGLFRVRYNVAGTPRVTIVVTTDDRTRDVNGREVRLLTHCLRSVVQKTAYRNYEVLVVDNGRLNDESAAYLATIPHRRVSYSYEGSFNFAHKLNFAVRHAQGDHLVIFNDDLEVISPEWMTAMLEFSQQQEVGAVGAKLLFPDGRLQHIGMVLGVCGVAAHAFHMAPGSSTGYAGGANLIRNYSAVTGACLMTRRAVFDEVDGFNEELAIDFNDVDFCLRLRQRGYRVVYTPYAQLYHLESGSQGPREQARTEKDDMKRLWADVVARDPYYNPNLTRDFPDHRIGV